VPNIAYPDHWQVRMVRQAGEILWRGERLFINQVLAGESVGLEEHDSGTWTVHFGPVLLGSINHAGQFQRPAQPRGRRGALRSPKAPRAAPAS